MAEERTTYESYPLRNDGKEWVVLLRDMHLVVVTARRFVRNTMMLVYITQDDDEIEGTQVWQLGAMQRDEIMEYQHAWVRQRSAASNSPMAERLAELYLLAYRFGLISYEEVSEIMRPAEAVSTYGRSRLEGAYTAIRQQQAVEEANISLMNSGLVADNQLTENVRRALQLGNNHGVFVAQEGSVIPAGTVIGYDSTAGTYRPVITNHETFSRAGVITEHVEMTYQQQPSVPLPKVSTFILQSGRRRRITVSSELK